MLRRFWGIHLTGVSWGVEPPRAGKHYPRSVGEFQAWFRTDADCLDYLEWLRWPAGFVCPGCGHGGAGTSATDESCVRAAATGPR